jgi:hypothetical protein
MRFRISTNRIFRLGAMLLASTVFVCLAPASVHASCGDYVIPGSSGSNHHLPPPTSAGVLNHPGSFHHTGGPLPDAIVRQHAPSRTPCQGPNCSRRSSIPPLAPQSVPPTALDQWAILNVDLIAILADETVGPLTNPSIGFAGSLSSRIFRPPR